MARRITLRAQLIELRPGSRLDMSMAPVRIVTSMTVTVAVHPAMQPQEHQEHKPVYDPRPI
ncbi:MAG: hypothetical protein QN198_01360 [Armatimonadota bacterium]|nr:hypothetical protein [Armatimonadota bacterium]MDR5702232.1 hypothetical protein [Armatimonadota bacterium]